MLRKTGLLRAWSQPRVTPAVLKKKKGTISLTNSPHQCICLSFSDINHEPNRKGGRLTSRSLNKQAQSGIKGNPVMYGIWGAKLMIGVWGTAGCGGACGGLMQYTKIEG